MTILEGSANKANERPGEGELTFEWGRQYPGI